ATKAQLLQLQSEGHEIMSHTNTHPYLTKKTLEELENEIKSSKEWLVNNGFKGESIAYPYGDFGEREKEVARKYFRSARSSQFGTNGLNDSPLATFELASIWLDGNVISNANNDPLGLGVNTLPYYQHYIDKAYENNSWLIISFHSWEDMAKSQLFIDVVDYTLTKCDVLTVSQALDKVGNVLEIGSHGLITPYTEHLTVGYDGKLKTNNLESKFEPINQFNGNNHIDDFPDYKVTVNRVSSVSAQNSGLPENTAGVLYTTKVSSRLEENIFNYQTYVTALRNTIYGRVVNADKSWGEWQPLSANNFIFSNTENSFDPLTPISSFKVGVTINRINTVRAQASNAPEPRAGVLITYRLSSTDNGYNWQEYRIHNDEKIYIRKFASDGTPQQWNMISYVNIKFNMNAFDPSTPIANFPSGITQNKVDGPKAAATNAPESIAGVLVTNKLDTADHNWNWQEYHIYGTSKVYKR